MLSPLLLTAFALLSRNSADTLAPAPVELESVTIIAAQEQNASISSGQVLLTAAELRRFELVDTHLSLQSQPGIFTQPEDGWGKMVMQ